jgi:hypothetical protein
MFQEWHSAIPLHGFRLNVALPSTKDSKIVGFRSHSPFFCYLLTGKIRQFL